MENCFQGIIIGDLPTAPCNGEFISTDCVATPNAITPLEIEAGATQTQINATITNALVYKEEQIIGITGDIQPYVERKIYRGTFLGSTLPYVSEDTINDLTISNLSVGNYTILSSSFNTATSVHITPNAITAGYEDITITYDYSNAMTGVIAFKVKNSGVLVNLLESPIKIES